MLYTRRHRFLCVAILALATMGMSAAGQGELPPWDEAQWIWTHPETGAAAGPVGFFRRAFALPGRVDEATLLVTADNGYEVYVNNRRVAGKMAYDASGWGVVDRFRIEELLYPGANVLAIRGESLGGAAGVIAAVTLLLASGERLAFVTDAEWRSTEEPHGDNWAQPDHNDTAWTPARVIAPVGSPPWGDIAPPDTLTDPEALAMDYSTPGRPYQPRKDTFSEPGPDFTWPAGVVFVAGRGPLHSTPAAQVVWDIHGSRATFENDVPAPTALGHGLYVLRPAAPGSEPELLVDAGAGLVGSPAVDPGGAWIAFAMVPEGGKFLHLYRIRPDGTALEQLTEGPWHDFEPAFLADGRIVFASTRMGSREEYHANAAQSLFVLCLATGVISPLTYHIVIDREPVVMADGRIAFVRHDNFMQRAKVETRVHAVRPDGTGGFTVMGPDRRAIGYDRATGAEHPDLWLRNHGFGSPAPMPDGRLAALTSFGPMITDSFVREHVGLVRMPSEVNLAEIAPMPDGRLLCGTQRGVLGVLDPATGTVVRLPGAPGFLHSIAFLGAQPAAQRIVPMAPLAPPEPGEDEPFGYFLCQNVFDSHQVHADWDRVTSVRLIEGRPLTLRAAHHQYGHIGVEAVELGTAPVAPDGSFYVKAPADRALAFQVIDAEGRAVVNEMSWVYLRPNERMSCTGCHAPRDRAPDFGTRAMPQAALAPPVELLGQGNAHRFRGNNAANGGILNLQFDRFREVAAINLHHTARDTAPAPGSVLPPGRSTAVAEAVTALRAKTAGDRIAAARRLAIFRDRGATEALGAALIDADVHVRLEAAQALAACGNRDAIPPLMGALGDSNANVAQAAHRALEHLTGLAVPFNPYAGPDIRNAGIAGWQNALREHPWDALEDRLIARVASPDPVERHSAIDALGHIGSPAGAAALRDYLESGNGESLAASLAAIRGLGHLRDDTAVPILDGILRANTERAPFTPPHSHEFGWAAAPDHLAAAAAESLGRIATPEAETALVEAFAALVEFWYYTFRCGDHEWLMGCHASPVHYRILEALDAAGSRKAGELTGAILRSVPMDPDRGLLFETDGYEELVARVLHRNDTARHVVETCLHVLGDPRAAPEACLREPVTASPPAVSVGSLCPESRAAHLLSVVARAPEDAPRIAAALERYLERDSSPTKSWTAFFLARTLGKLGGPCGVPVLLMALEGPVEAAHGVPDVPNVFLHNAPTPLYRAAAADALGRIGDVTAVPVLLAAAGDFGNAMDVRHAAALALERLAAPESARELEQLARAYPEVVTGRALRAAFRAAAGASGTDPDRSDPGGM